MFFFPRAVAVPLNSPCNKKGYDSRRACGAVKNVGFCKENDYRKVSSSAFEIRKIDPLLSVFQSVELSDFRYWKIESFLLFRLYFFKHYIKCFQCSVSFIYFIELNYFSITSYYFFYSFVLLQNRAKLELRK